jgi:DNA-binding CsgD family transcriptional regulator
MNSEAVTFTARQRQVVELIAAGYSNLEIALALDISERTVRAHCEVVRHKLGDVPRRRIPLAYRRATGADPLAWVVADG